MPIRPNLPILIAQATTERRRRGLPKMTLRILAEESNVALSVIAALNTNASKRLDYDTLEKLLVAFNRYFPTTLGDVLIWDREDTRSEGLAQAER